VRHADYIGSWLEVLREDNRATVRAASSASKAADYILGRRRRLIRRRTGGGVTKSRRNVKPNILACVSPAFRICGS
jgi:antirestriction protein ArdC